MPEPRSPEPMSIVASHHGIAPPHDPNATVTITLDGQSVEARAGEFLIETAERAGTYIPRFCYHPRMKPVGMCRMCLVDITGPRGPSLQPACYLAVSEGLEVDTKSDRVRKAQDGVLEFLLINHPLDCPVCDKGGECPLQDQVMAYGPGESRFVEEKRHWAKPIPISELVMLDRERCIQCGRCVRFALEVAGEAQIDFLGRGDTVEVNIFEDQPFSSYFSGNTVQICPVGALTASPYRFTARPWDLDQVESTCTTCALGCRVAVQSSANRLTRLLGVDSDSVNQSWLCDKGRFGYEAVNSEERLMEPLVRENTDSDLSPASWTEALDTAANNLLDVREQHGSEAIGVIGGARLSNEDAYAWARLAKSVLGTDSVDAQLGDGLPAELMLALPRATIDEACRARCVVTLAGDLREELPVLFLRLRAAVEDLSTRIIELTQTGSSLTPYATSIAYRPGESPAVARALSSGAKAPNGVSEDLWGEALSAVADSAGGGKAASAVEGKAASAAEGEAPGEGEGIVVVLGRTSLAEDPRSVAEAAGVLADAWPKARFLPALRRGNILGALEMGLAPGVLPGRVSLEAGADWFSSAWGSVPSSRGRDTSGILEAAADGSLKALILLGADPLGDFPDRKLAHEALERVPFILSVDTFLSPSSSRSNVVLPAVMHHERSGTTTNVEGRITRVAQKLVAPGQCWPDWMIAAELAMAIGTDLGIGSAVDLWDEIERVAPSHAGITRAVLDSVAGREGIVAPLGRSQVKLSRRGPVPIDPMATPGIDAVERQGVFTGASLAEPPGWEDPANGHVSNGSPKTASKPPLLSWPQEIAPASVPAPDSYSLRLVSGRRLYDHGLLLSTIEPLSKLAGAPSLRANQHDLDRLGAASGTSVRVRSSRGSVVMQAESDPNVPRGVVEIGFNLVDADGVGARSLIDVGETVVDVRLETV